MKVTAIFDIGKTNKKFFLFDEDYQQVYKAYRRFEGVEDEDGYPSDNLKAIQNWMKELFDEILASKKYKVRAINFSTYGASLVHLGKEGKPLTPFYNYTKPMPPEIMRDFYGKYGDQAIIAMETGSPASGMLNSGFQLYWLKYSKPEIFNQIRYSLHFPQYLSYLFTGIPVSDYTSIGCHTSLWNYEEADYHDWVYEEEIDKILPPIVPTETSINMEYGGKHIRIGIGIHDSSASLLPYLKCDPHPFLLISTGTWSISLNPYSTELLDREALANDCLNYMRIDGKPVKASRLFLGNEYKVQVDKLLRHFKLDYGYHKKVRFDEKLYYQQRENYRHRFHFESIDLRSDQPPQTEIESFENFEQAFHQLMLELMELQVESAWRAIGETPIQKLYIDGGFTDNDMYVKLLSYHFNNYKLRTTQSPLGSALGAAMVISNQKVDPKFLKKHYGLKKHVPLILDV